MERWTTDHSTRFMIFAQRRQCRGHRPERTRAIFPNPDGSNTTRRVWARAPDVIGLRVEEGTSLASDLAAVGITNQRETPGVGPEHR